MWTKLKPYLISIVIALGIGGLAAFLIKDNLAMYERIIRPVLAPKAYVFPIAWTILYILMGISSARVWLQRKEKPELVLDALMAYVIQLILNFFWSILFFNMQNFLFSFIWLVLLWLLILKTTSHRHTYLRLVVFIIPVIFLILKISSDA